jgi:hypothetical protein
MLLWFVVQPPPDRPRASKSNMASETFVNQPGIRADTSTPSAAVIIAIDMQSCAFDGADDRAQPERLDLGRPDAGRWRISPPKT